MHPVLDDWSGVAGIWRTTAVSRAEDLGDVVPARISPAFDYRRTAIFTTVTLLRQRCRDDLALMAEIRRRLCSSRLGRPYLKDWSILTPPGLVRMLRGIFGG